MHVDDVFAEMLKAYADGTQKLFDDEYLGDDGLPHCKNCRTARVYVSDDKKFMARCMCECQSQAEAEREQERKRQRAIDEFNNRSQLSMIGSRYRNIRFADATITDNNRAVYDKCRNYVNRAKEIRENNIGLYIYGDNSSGKTYLTACVCNELLWRGYRCVYTNLATMLNEIRGSYDGQGMGECELINPLLCPVLSE